MRVVAKLKHVCRVRSKGTDYYYVRMPGHGAVRMLERPGTPDFLAEYKHIMADLAQGAQGPKMPPGSLGWLIEAFRKSDRWQDLKPRTKESYLRAIGFLKGLEAIPAKEFTRPAILKIRDEKLRPDHGIWTANYCVMFLGLAFAYAYDMGMVKQNPLAERVRRLRKPKDAPKANRPWSPQERATVLSEAPPHLRLVLTLAMCTGLRKGDVLTVTMGAIKDGTIEVRTAKRGRLVRVPIHPLLAEALALRPQSDALQIALTSYGTAWTYDGFNASWQAFKGRLEKEGKIAPGLTIHGLRHTLGHLLHEAGATDRDIADMLAHKGTAMAQHYSDGADLSDAAKATVLRLPIIR